MGWRGEWAGRFARAREELLRVLPAEATVEHFGSTSVPGLAAKPIIDILVVTEHLHRVDIVHRRLESLSYFLIARYFADDPDHVCFGRNTAGRRAENLHLFHPRSPQPRANRDFRDYLIAHPDAADRYARAKREAAALHPGSRAGYSDHKAEVVRSLLLSAAEWSARRRSLGTGECRG